MNLNITLCPFQLSHINNKIKQCPFKQNNIIPKYLYLSFKIFFWTFDSVSHETSTTYFSMHFSHFCTSDLLLNHSSIIENFICHIQPGYSKEVSSSHKIIRCIYDTHTSLLDIHWQDGNFWLKQWPLVKLNHT